MQNLNYNIQHQKAFELTKYVLLLTIALIFWFYPYTHNACLWLDYQTFKILNSSLLHSHTWRIFWGYLNHPNESWLNIFVMVGINLLGIYSLSKDKRLKSLASVAFFWIFFQVVLLFTNLFFLKWLGIHRASPSLEITPWVILSDVLNINNLKVSSNCSFPSGHALVLVFWLKFTLIYSRGWIRILAIATAILLTLPRLFSGAHWLSDVLFTICYALVWFKIAELCLEKINILLEKKKLIGEA